MALVPFHHFFPSLSIPAICGLMSESKGSYALPPVMTVSHRLRNVSNSSANAACTVAASTRANIVRPAGIRKIEMPDAGASVLFVFVVIGDGGLYNKTLSFPAERPVSREAFFAGLRCQNTRKPSRCHLALSSYC